MKWLSEYQSIVREIVDCNNRRNLVSEELRLITEEHTELMKRKADIQIRLDLEIIKMPLKEPE